MKTLTLDQKATRPVLHLMALEAPDVDLINKTPPPAESVPDYKAQILERTVVAALGVLGVLGAHIT